MENKIGFTGTRKAFIDSINADGTYNIYFSDDNSNNIIKNVNTVNTGSFGSGIFSRYHEGAPVWVLQSHYYQPIIVGFANIPGTIEDGSILETNDIDAPDVDSGEIVIQASSGAHIDLRASGDIKLSNLKNDGLFLSDTHRAVFLNSYQYYNINDSGYTVEGRVKRFSSGYMPGQDPVFIDLLTDPEADAFTTDIARDQTQQSLPMNRARGLSNVIRNPAFSEKREQVLEFADSFFVRDAQVETDLASEFPKTLQEMSRSIAVRRGYGQNEQTFDNLRHTSRTNLLKLDTNVMIERVQGTLVDIFGNVLDLNYNKLNFPKLLDKGKESIAEAHALLTRSVAYHFQVNSRNIIDSSSTGNGKFTFDIDKEGQFKLNVPRSTTTGTVPTLSIFSTEDTDLDSRIDITNIQLSKSTIATPTGGIAGSAFHDMTLTADRLIRHSIKSVTPIRVHGNTLSMQSNGDTPNIEFMVTDTTTADKIPSYTTTVSVQAEDSAISKEIDPGLAGGRSGQMNFEGSLEISIGKDETDEKSLMLDTAGSLIAWFGMDNHGRSIVANTDGAVSLNIGDYTTDSDGNTIFNQGELMIRVNLVDEKDPKIQLQPETAANNKTTSDHIIYIGPKGIVIASGNGTPLAIRSSGDLLIEAAGVLDLKAKEIRVDSGYLRKIKASKGDI